MAIPIYQEAKINDPLCRILESCSFCSRLTNTWHENTNMPVCPQCSREHSVSDIPGDHGQTVRKHKRQFAAGEKMSAHFIATERSCRPVFAAEIKTILGDDELCNKTFCGADPALRISYDEMMTQVRVEMGISDGV